MNYDAHYIWWNRWTSCEVWRSGFHFRLLWLRLSVDLGAASVMQPRKMRSSGGIVPLYDADLNPINRDTAGVAE